MIQPYFCQGRNPRFYLSGQNNDDLYNCIDKQYGESTIGTLTVTTQEVRMNTVELADAFKIAHRSVMRTCRDLKEREIFNVDEIEPSTYTTGQNKVHNCFKLSDEVVSYIITNYRAFRSSGYRVLQCSKILSSINVNHKVVLGDATRSEIKFGITLSEFFGDSITVIQQYQIAGRYIDFFIPEISLAIEYDERHHNTRSNKQRDSERQELIDNYIKKTGRDKLTWVRIDEGFEIQGLREIVGAILYHGFDDSLNYLGFDKGFK